MMTKGSKNKNKKASKITLPGITDLKGYKEFSINVVGLEKNGKAFNHSGQCRCFRMTLPTPKNVEEVKAGLVRIIQEAIESTTTE